MPRSLHGRLFLLMAGLLTLIGSLSFIMQSRSEAFYQQAVLQALNAQRASTFVQTYIRDQESKEDQIVMIRKALAHTTNVNPAVDLYLIDEKGQILAFAGPSQSLVRHRIDPQPLRQFIKGEGRFPIVGDDPKYEDKQRIFSAAMIRATDGSSIYLYAIIKGATDSKFSASLGQRLIWSDTVSVLLFGMLAALMFGTIVLFTMTRKLRQLIDSMNAFRLSNFREPMPFVHALPTGGDEIDQLGQSYNVMVEHIDRQMRDIERHDASRRELLASVSHDLRTPLAALRGYLETLLLKEGSLSSTARRSYLEIASRQSEHLTRLVAELFELAKLESHDLRLNVEPFNLAELVFDVKQKLQIVALKSEVELYAEIQGTDIFFEGDIALIERVLDNLLHNAVRHTPPQGKVWLMVEAKSDVVIVRVKDTGMGIPKEDLPFIFDRFYRVDKSRNDRSGGAGLGLAITKRIIELHGGRIEVRSTVDQGTSFTLWLPRTRRYAANIPQKAGAYN